MTFDQPWARQSACSSLDDKDIARIFFSDKPGINLEARRICSGCQVQTLCLNYALHRPEWGIWGGLTADERVAMRRRNGIRLPSGQAARKAAREAGIAL
jgi:WhiB family redox-sensing transcriptional regulator